MKTASRLAGVDGLRAAAAFWVVLFHIRVFSGVHLPFQPLDFFVRSGSTGVSLFLVLSGFCLWWSRRRSREPHVQHSRTDRAPALERSR